MEIIDKGHIYKVEVNEGDTPQYLKFVKRSGGAVTYAKEWPGVQTQAVMRAVIQFLEVMEMPELNFNVVYPLWQLGDSRHQHLTLHGVNDLRDVLLILIDRSEYLNGILSCNETLDAITWLKLTHQILGETTLSHANRYQEAAYNVRMALWCYEARAYRRKREAVNRLQPAHDDTARLKPWREHPAEDVPFTWLDIENKPIGPDGHILLP